MSGIRVSGSEAIPFHDVGRGGGIPEHHVNGDINRLRPIKSSDILLTSAHSRPGGLDQRIGDCWFRVRLKTRKLKFRITAWYTKTLWWHIFSIVHTVAACTHYVYQTYQPNDEPIALAGLDVYFGIVFFVDYILSVITAPTAMGYIFSVAGIADVLSVASCAASWNRKVLILSLFRYLRLFKAMRVVRMYKLLYRFMPFGYSSDLAYNAMLLLLRMMGLILVLSTVIQALNVDKIMRFNQYLDWDDALYYVIVTLTTLGYGDIFPINTSGKMLMVVAILCCFIFIPYEVNKLIQALHNLPRHTVGYKFAGGHLHVVIAMWELPGDEGQGEGFDASVVRRMLTELLHDDRGEAGQIWAVLLCSSKPSTELEALLKAVHLKNRVMYYRGSVRDARALAAVKAQYADCIFLCPPTRRKRTCSTVSPAQAATEAEQDGEQCLLAALSLQRYLDRTRRDMRIMGQVHHLSTTGGPGRVIVCISSAQVRERLSFLGRSSRVVCQDELRHAMMACGAVNPSFLSFAAIALSTTKRSKDMSKIFNAMGGGQTFPGGSVLSRESFDGVSTNNGGGDQSVMAKWMEDYLSGAMYELYVVRLSLGRLSNLSGLSFGTLAYILYCSSRGCALLLGAMCGAVPGPDGKPHFVSVNISDEVERQQLSGTGLNSYIMPMSLIMTESTFVFVMAPSRPEAEQHVASLSLLTREQVELIQLPNVDNEPTGPPTPPRYPLSPTPMSLPPRPTHLKQPSASSVSQEPLPAATGTSTALVSIPLSAAAEVISALFDLESLVRPPAGTTTGVPTIDTSNYFATVDKAHKALGRALRAGSYPHAPSLLGNGHSHENEKGRQDGARISPPLPDLMFGHTVVIAIDEPHLVQFVAPLRRLSATRTSIYKQHYGRQNAHYAPGAIVIVSPTPAAYEKLQSSLAALKSEDEPELWCDEIFHVIGTGKTVECMSAAKAVDSSVVVVLASSSESDHDSHSLLACFALERELSEDPYTECRLIVALRHQGNICFLRQHAHHPLRPRMIGGVLRSHTGDSKGTPKRLSGKMFDIMRSGHAKQSASGSQEQQLGLLEAQLWPTFAAGSVWIDNFVDSLVVAVYFNPELLTFFESLCGVDHIWRETSHLWEAPNARHHHMHHSSNHGSFGRPVIGAKAPGSHRDRRVGSNSSIGSGIFATPSPAPGEAKSLHPTPAHAQEEQEQCRRAQFHTITITGVHFKNSTYGDLVDYLLPRGCMPIGLYRPPGLNDCPLPYTHVNPSPDEMVHKPPSYYSTSPIPQASRRVDYDQVFVLRSWDSTVGDSI